jgi:alcohol dehydrogenase class IV
LRVDSFTYETHPARVLFGSGRLAELPAELDRLHVRRAMVITTPAQRGTGEQLMDALIGRAAALFDGAVMHTPTDVTNCALQLLRERNCDSLVAIGGGSTIGLGKALSLRTGLPQIAIPTTYAGSEVTPILGETEGGVKTTQRSPKLLPRVVIYDVQQTLGLPASLSASSGMNAIAHAAEALYAVDRNPIVSLMAKEGIAALARSLPAIVRNGGDVAARVDAQYGAWLCGTCLGAVGMALHHKLCHVLGGTFDLPHAETHAILLPYALAYNADAASEAMNAIQSALGACATPWLHLHGMLAELGLPLSLEELGMPRHGIAHALELVMTGSYRNPRPMKAEPLRRLLEAAYYGAVPAPF